MLRFILVYVAGVREGMWSVYLCVSVQQNNVTSKMLIRTGDSRQYDRILQISYTEFN